MTRPLDRTGQTLNTVAIGLVAVALLANLWVSCGSDPCAIESPAPRPINDALVERLKVEEGFRAHLYRDTADAWTIGFGTNVSEGVTEAEGELLLRSRLLGARESLLAAWPAGRELPHVVQDALADAAYQLGVHGLLEFHAMLAALERGDYAGAADEAIASEWAHETPVRAQRLADVLATKGRR